MGLKIGRAFKKLVKGAVKVAPAIVGGFAGGGPVGAVFGGLQATAARKLTGTVAARVPSIQEVTGVSPFFTDGTLPVPRAGMPPVVPVQATMALAISGAVMRAIVKLAATLGVVVTAQNIGRVGLRLWRSVTALARRYPGVSILTFLAGLGLTLDEAGEFLFWGQTKKRRRRRGISGRDIAITRRTLRRLDMFRMRLGVRRGPRGRRRGTRGDGTVVVAQQD